MGDGYYGEYRWDENGNEYLVINVDYLDDFWQTIDTIGHEVMGHKMTKNIIESGVKPDGMSDSVWQDMRLSYTNMVNSYVETDPYYEQQQSETDAQKSGLYFKVKFEVNRINNRKVVKND